MKDFLSVVIALNGGNERGSYTNLANKLNIARSQVSDWIAGRRKPTEAQAKLMSQLFLESKEVQATGISVTLRSIKMMFGMKDALQPASDFGIVYLPLLAALPAGPADYYDGEKIKELPFPKEFIDGASYLILCNGDSMSPTLEKGDLLFVKPADHPIFGKIMIVETEGGYTIKRVKKIDGVLRLVADNPNYVCKDKCIGVRGIVVNYMRKPV